MNYFVSSHDAERKLRILISERIPFFSVKKKSKKEKKKKNKQTAVGLTTSLSAGCLGSGQS